MENKLLANLKGLGYSLNEVLDIDYNVIECYIVQSRHVNDRIEVLSIYNKIDDLGRIRVAVITKDGVFFELYYSNYHKFEFSLKNFISVFLVDLTGEKVINPNQLNLF